MDINQKMIELSQSKIKGQAILIEKGRKSLEQVDKDYQEAVELLLLERGFYDKK